MTAPSIAIGTYRDAVDDLMIELAAHRTPGDARKVTRILTERLVEREFSDLFAATPHGVEATQRMVIAEAEAFRPNGESRRTGGPARRACVSHRPARRSSS